MTRGLQELREAVLLPMRLPHLFSGLRRPQVNVLLHGVPGTGACWAPWPPLHGVWHLSTAARADKLCQHKPHSAVHGHHLPLLLALRPFPSPGKTLLVEKLAAEAGTPLLAVSPSAILSKWAGESEKTLRGVFEAAAALAPSIIFLDEVDSLAPTRCAWGHGGLPGPARAACIGLPDARAAAGSVQEKHPF